MPRIVPSPVVLAGALAMGVAAPSLGGGCVREFSTYHAASRVNGESYQLADMDGDGRHDLVSVDNSRICRIYLNGGAGFTLWTSFQLPAHGQLAALKDFDGDGRADILSNSINGQNCLGNLIRIFWNGGEEIGFSPSTYTELPLPSSPYCVQSREIDFDADGDLDVIMTSMAGNSRTFRNNGSRNFTVASSFQWPRDLYYTNVKDYDGDGHADYVALHKSGWADGQWGAYLYRGDGNGSFQPAIVNFAAERAAAGISINANPLDDSREDVAVYVGNSITQVIRLGRWAGSNFAWTPIDVPVPFQVTEAFDANEDGFQDMILVNTSGPHRMSAMLNDGHGSFPASGVVELVAASPYPIQTIRQDAGAGGDQFILAVGPTEVLVLRATCSLPCPGDVTGNGTVDSGDLTFVLGFWGTDGGKFPGVDIDGDGEVEADDLGVVLAGWGACP